MRKQNNKPGLLQPEAQPPRPHHWKPEKSAASWVKRDIEDIQRDPRFRQYPHLARQKIRFYAGVPIQSKQGLAIGSLCILDKQVRQMSEEDLDLLKALALDLQETLSSERLRKQKLEEILRLGQADLSQAVVTES